jgi:hypothetical protein
VARRDAAATTRHGLIFCFVTEATLSGLKPAVIVWTITVGFEIGGDGSVYHQQVKSNAFKTGGDSHFQPAVIGYARVVYKYVFA